MKYYYECFNKKLILELYENDENLLNFWLYRFCPNIKQIDIKNISDFNSDLTIEFIKSDKYDYVIEKNKIQIFGELTKNNSYIAKFVTQCFQYLLIEDDILIIPAACVSNKKEGLLIIGDFWQGKTSVSLNISYSFSYNLVSDNYVAIKDGNVIGATNYISIRKEDITDEYDSILNINDRYFYENKYRSDYDLKIVGFLLPYINNGDNNIHNISLEESKWYLYQKFTRLLCGETILFEGKLPSPIFLTKEISNKILYIIQELLKTNNIRYVSSSMENIKKEGKNILYKGEI